MGSCCTKLIEGKVTAVSHFKLKRGTKPERKELDSELLKLTDVKAALLIQKWFRVWSSKLRVRREIAWNVFQEIEYFGEHHQLKLSKMFKVLIEEFQDTAKVDFIQQRLINKAAGRPSVIDVDTSIKDLEIPQIIPNDYVGIVITLPYSSNKLQILVNDFRCGKIIHAAYVSQILRDTILKLKSRNNLYRITTTSVNKKVTIIGDLHGSLDDLLTIFHKNNLPSTTNPYVFNGDIVDRGPKCVEVCMIIFYCILVFPNHVFLNRGNHEDPILNRRYGFIKEITLRFRTYAKRLLKMFNILFKYLPLGSIIDNKILVVHGGISDELDLKKINQIPRTKFVSVIKPGSFFEVNEKCSWGYLLDLLWSDPSNQKGCTENEFRGSGKYFGPDITSNFLEENNLVLLIRSHECKVNGYEYTHDNQVLTIFSASNYYERGSNKGAFVIYRGDEKNLSIIPFVSNEDALNNLNIKDQIISLEISAFSKIKQMISLKLPELKEALSQYDKDGTGTVSAKDFSTCLGAVLKLKVPWRLIINRICDVDSDNMVHYENTFKILDLSRASKHPVADIVYANREILETIFRTFDVDNSGAITMQEFKDGMMILQRCTSHIFKEGDIAKIGKTMDFDKDGNIDINEFFEAFRISAYTW
ncbi:serine/threonine-protein phosphatase with EF-hands 2-like [Octopus vulgaris]|uniref:Serine/threonine-protein phosphatase with EF-hands 2-like n=2 Tax=Octopus TaxID=6643 RepID=A0AA36FEC8_OCTVU|nr:serine/threonine-protein phosphatase with EF-hands 2-like [Octopus sinensis]CAI9734512.1 serine/threonine-protein phosphatase with EF-hands 2-like [Octopus vulgaris]